MNFPLLPGADNIATLVPTVVATSNTPNVGLILSNANGQAIISYSTNPNTTNPANPTPNVLVINPTNGRVYRKFAADGINPSNNYEQLAPFVCCIAQSTAGNLFTLANTTYYIDFPTVVYDPLSGVAGTGSGNITTSASAWRYNYPMKGFYLISTIIEYSNVASNNAQLFSAGNLYTYGSEAMSATGNTINRTSISSTIVNFTGVIGASTSIIQVQGRAGAANTSQTTTAANNKVVIAYMGRSNT